MTIVNFAGHNVLRLGSNLILTRILFPEAFGLMTLVQVVLFGAAMFSDFGIRGSIVQDERGEDPAFLNTAWTLQILRGLLLSLVILLIAAPMSRFYDEPRLAELLFVCAIIPTIQGLNSTNLASAGRHIVLGRVTWLTLFAQLVGILVMIYFAWLLQSVWALVIGNVFTAIVHAALSHIVIPGQPNRLGFEWDAAKRLFGFGKYIFLATLAGFFINHADKAVLGKFITLEQLAIYNIGFFLATVPQKFARKLNDQVIFPLYARRPPRDSAENRTRINRARFLLTGLLVTGMLVLALIGDPFVRLLYDPRYEAAGPILVLIALATMPQLITLSYERLPMSMGHSGRYAALMVCRASTQLLLTIVGVQMYGLGGAILAPALAWLLTYPFLVYIIRPYMGWDPLHDVVSVVVITALIAVVLWLNGPLLAPLLPAI